MKSGWLWILISVNLLVLIALAFVYPDLMIGPGPLAQGHSALATDCFACHAPFRGAAADRCIKCHAPQEIGLRSTQGVAIPQARHVKASFHQQLSEQDCMACHSDHAGPKLTQRSRKAFSHALLRIEARDRCESCHAAPRDRLHQKISGNCSECHTTAAWKPASFDHSTFFPLDENHNASCATCHTGNNYRQYTCYGCHEHTPANVQARHREEGPIRNIDDCVRCHRSASGEGEGGRESD